MRSESPIPSPQATGGAGGNYEQHVGAACLSILLTGGVAPFSSDSILVQVHLQARHLRFQTDDVLLIAEGAQAQQRRIAIQAKRTFALSATNEECVKTLRAAWDDFTNTELFVPEEDRLALITGQAPSTFTKGMRTLLDMARATLDAADFSRRRGLAGYCSKEARSCYETVADILRDRAGEALSDDVLWRFLRVWDFAVLDFQSPSSVTEALIKSLLAATANGPTAADDTWNALLNLVGEWSGHARSFNWGALPAELRDRHGRPAAAERGTYETLRAASNMVRTGVSDRLAGTVTLGRPSVLSDGLAEFNNVDVLLVTGPAGSGKSVMAAWLYDALAGGTLALAFRADTLATAHLATSAQQLGISLPPLLRLFTLHPRKLLWVESGERFFEKSAPEREAFGDLLRLLARDHGWKLLITCRDYSAELIRTAFLEPAGLRTAVLTVPALTDPELEAAADGLPKLRVPLREPALREILRNPFYLHLAARMDWSESAPPALSRRAFREKAWREVVCRTGEGPDGLSIERDRTMVEIARRRAQALTPYVDVEGLPPRAVAALTRDSLLAAHPDDASAQFAPAHDLYEDWALLQWLSRLPTRTGGVNAAFFEALGLHPALRRSFRLWLLEQLDTAPGEAQQRVLAVMNDDTLPAHWRDEALVAVFQAASAPTLLRELRPRLASDVGLLRRAVHLLRVSCRRLPAGSSVGADTEPVALVPDGLAWDTMPELILAATKVLLVPDLLWILGFLEDWARGAKTQSDPPAGPAVGRLCNLLLDNIHCISEQYQGAYRERVLRVMLSVPRAMGRALQAMVEKAVAAPRPDAEGQLILQLIWSHFSGTAVARDLPDLALRVVEHRLRLECPAADDEDRRRYRSLDANGNAVFGLGHLSDFEYHPASAWQGPFLNLLTFDPERGIDLLLRLVNGCCTAYANALQGFERHERLVEIALPLADGTLRRQWAHGRLWCLYRATSVGPGVLASGLMALEAWLLQKGERGDADLRAVFSRLLADSNNVAITAVLVSVAVAYPYLLSDAAVPLIVRRDFFDAEHERYMHDWASGTSQPVDYLPERDPEKKLYWRERRESAQKSHRRSNLESLVVDLQFTSARPLVWEFLDGAGRELPAEATETDADRIWRLRLHRMDVRNFVIARETDDGHILLHAGPPPPALEAFRDRDLPEHQERERRTSLFLWGTHVFEGGEAEKYPPAEWREKLAAVRALPVSEGTALPLFGGSGTAQIAVVCLRDHWNELDDGERDWCANIVCTQIESLTQRRALAAALGGPMGGVGPCAQLVSVLAARLDDPVRRARARQSLATVLLHPEGQIAQAAAWGVGAHLFATDRALALRCVRALLDWVRERARFRAAQRALPRNQREREDVFDDHLRTRLAEGLDVASPFDESALFTTDFLRQPGVHVLKLLLAIFSHAYADPLAQRFHVHVVGVLLAAWQGVQGRRRHAFDEEDDSIELRHVEEHYVTRALARFTLSCPDDTARAIIAPLVEAAHERPKEIAEFIEHLIICLGERHSSARFWMLWRAFADVVSVPDSGTPTDEDEPGVDRLLAALFLDISWNPGVQEWPPLAGQGGRVLDFFRRLPPSAATVRAFAALAARFRGEFIPRALPVLAQQLARLPDRLFLAATTMGALEAILGTLVYSGAVDIRHNADLRTATLTLLDMLVEAGSSAAFKMRDDFLTPLRG